MDTNALLLYEEKERAFARTQGAKAVTEGFVSNATAIYSDLNPTDRLGFYRNGAPLPALLFLYETTVVYIPPADRSTIQRKLGVKWRDLLRLIEKGCIQPIIGHPTHYANRAHFDELFEYMPPSVWARGDELARKFANADEYWEMAESLLSLDEMAQVSWIRAKFQRHFPHLGERELSRRIATEVGTNFVDLCIYGYEPLARDLAGLSNLDWSTRRILETSELLTYPTLIGLGGTANYGLQTAPAVAEAASNAYIAPSPLRLVSGEAQLLLEGLSISAPGSIDVELILNFHKDGMSTHLWLALEELESKVAEVQLAEGGDLLESAVVAANVIRSTMREVRSVGYSALRSRTAATSRPWTDLTVKLGSTAAVTVAAHAPLGLDWVEAAVAGAGFASTMFAFKKFDAVTARVEERIVRHVAERHSSRLATQLWWLSDWRERAGRSHRL